MPDSRKWYQQPRTWFDLLLGAVCIGLLVMMLKQLNSLQKLEGDVDRLRVQLEAKKGSQPPGAARAPEPGPATAPKKP